MAVFGGPNNFGLFTNGDFRKGDTSNFLLTASNTTPSTYRSSGGPDGGPYIELTGGSGKAAFSSEFLEVDTSDTYQMVTYAKTITLGSDTDIREGQSSHLIGFACYDSSKRFIDNRHTGGMGNTTLSRPLNDGDTKFYIATESINQLNPSSFSQNGWITGSDLTYDDATQGKKFHYRHVVLFPASHPEYGTAYEYSRIGLRGGGNGGQNANDGYTLCYKSLTLTSQNDLEGTFCDTNDNDLTFSTASAGLDANLPTGTPVSRGVASSTYNYAVLKAPGNTNRDVPTTWTRFSTAPFTGEDRTGTTPFRFATKFIKFLILKNYYAHTDGATQDHVWGLGQIFFGKVLDNKDYRNNLL
jgi:hypothetical protein